MDVIRFFDRISAALVLLELCDEKRMDLMYGNIHRLTNDNKQQQLIKTFITDYVKLIDEEE